MDSQELESFLLEQKGANIIQGILSVILMLSLGAIMLGFLYEVGDDVMSGQCTRLNATTCISNDANNTYNKIKSKGFVILYMVIIIPIALVVGAVMSVIG